MHCPIQCPYMQKLARRVGQPWISCWGSPFTSINSTRFSVTAKIEIPNAASMRMHLKKYFLHPTLQSFGNHHCNAKKQLSNYPIALWIIYHQGRLNHQRRVEKRPRPGRYWKPWRLVSWNLKQNIFTVWALAMYQYSNLNIHMYGRWTSDEHGLKPDRSERLDDLPLPHIRLWAASSSSSGGFQSLVLEITNRSNHGSVTLWELGTKKRSQRCKFTWFLRFCFLKMGDRNRFLGPGCRGGGVLVVVWESARREQSTASSFHSPLRTATGRDHPPTSENKHHNWKRSACQQGWILLDTVSTKFNLREKLKISNKWY